jgi:hypothetical protein
MKSLFDKVTLEEFISRINNLDRKALPQWGKMNVSQMLHHCQMTFLIASGDMIPRINPLVKFFFGNAARKQLLNDKEFKKNIPTFPEGKIVGQKEFDVEKGKLITLIKNFQQRGPDGLTKEPHSFFGKLSVEEWDRLQVKHLDHHLRQFGV